MEISDRPIIKLFLCDGKYYMYDTCNNALLEVTPAQYKELMLMDKIGVSAYLALKKTQKEYRDICMLERKGFLKSKIIDKVENPLTPYIEQMLQSCVNDIVLQVTKDCNFKCRYCSFANMTGIDRNHEKQNMTWEIAKKGVDFLYAHCRDAMEVNIAFYGGEPLLNYPLIKQVVEYANDLFLTKKIIYRMTTNASLLTDDNIAFLVENNFKLSLSIDGEEKIQNLHRSFLENGGETFRVVIRNLEKIKQKYPDFFKENIGIMAVVVEGEDYNQVLEFFETLGMDRTQIRLLNAELGGVDFYANVFMEDDTVEESNNVAAMNAVNKLTEVYQEKNLLAGTWHHNGTCIPGIKRIFVGTDGKCYPCEKILLRDNLSIGSLDDGLDIKKIVRFTNIGKLSEERCKHCWAMRFCEICVSQCNDIELCDLTKEQKSVVCDSQEKQALWYLKNKVIRKK